MPRPYFIVHRLPLIMGLFRDRRLPVTILSWDRQLAKILDLDLLLLVVVVVGFATVELLLQSGVKDVHWQTERFDGSLI